MRIIIECSFILFLLLQLVKINTHFQAVSNTPEYFSEVCELLWGIVDFLLPPLY